MHLGKIAKVQPFTNARTNQVFLITTEDGQKTVFKRLNLKARSPDKRKQELALQHLASSQGLSTKVLADCQLYRLQTYIEGDVLSNTCLDPRIIKLFASQLQIIHQLPVKYVQPQNLAFELNLLKKQLKTPIDQREFKHFLQLAMQLDKSSAKDTLCHGDLSFSNLIQTENGQIKILDWEYAVVACPAYDIAACACINELNLDQVQGLTSGYYFLHDSELSISQSQLQKDVISYRAVFSYLNELWGLVFTFNNAKVGSENNTKEVKKVNGLSG